MRLRDVGRATGARPLGARTAKKLGDSESSDSPMKGRFAETENSSPDRPSTCPARTLSNSPDRSRRSLGSDWLAERQAAREDVHFSSSRQPHNFIGDSIFAAAAVATDGVGMPAFSNSDRFELESGPISSVMPEESQISYALRPGFARAVRSSEDSGTESSKLAADCRMFSSPMEELKHVKTQLQVSRLNCSTASRHVSERDAVIGELTAEVAALKAEKCKLADKVTALERQLSDKGHKISSLMQELQRSARTTDRQPTHNEDVMIASRSASGYDKQPLMGAVPFGAGNAYSAVQQNITQISAQESTGPRGRSGAVSPHTISHCMVNTESACISCFEAGIHSDRPTLVILPGLCCSAQRFLSSLLPLATTTNLLAIDWRGHGKSIARNAHFGAALEELAKDTVSVLRAKLPQGKPFCVLGHSVGARVLWSMCGMLANDPFDRLLSALAGVATIDHPPGAAIRGPDHPHYAKFKTDSDFMKRGPEEMLSIFEKTWGQSREFMHSREDFDEWLKFAAGCDPQLVGNLWFDGLTTDYTFEMNSIKCPALIIVGSSTIGASTIGQRFCSAVPPHGAHFALLIGGTHCLQYQASQLAELNFLLELLLVGALEVNAFHLPQDRGGGVCLPPAVDEFQRQAVINGELSAQSKASNDAVQPPMIVNRSLDAVPGSSFNPLTGNPGAPPAAPGSMTPPHPGALQKVASLGFLQGPSRSGQPAPTAPMGPLRSMSPAGPTTPLMAMHNPAARLI